MTIVDLDAYDYVLPPELVRRTPVEPRDSARLFVYDTATDTVTHTTFADVAAYLPPHALLVLNATRVVPARLVLTKPTGGRIEVFVLANEMRPGDVEIPFITDRKCLPGWDLALPGGGMLQVVRQDGPRFYGRLSGTDRPLNRVLADDGATPIPPYLEGGTLDEAALRIRYQTVFAHAGASVAAPTASLHFTPAVFASLVAAGIDRTELILDVGRGTFAPLSDENFRTQRLHPEYVTVPPATAAAVTAARCDSRPVVAVGTTVMRSLESRWHDGALEAGEGYTDIFIYPPHTFAVCDALITNFHLPRTSLLLLVDAFLRHKGARRGVMDLYAEAIREGYAFYSFGDSMLIR